MTPHQSILAAYGTTSLTEREKCTYFEDLIRTYPRSELAISGSTARGTGKADLVLFIAPMLKLLSQTPRAGKQVSDLPL